MVEIKLNKKIKLDNTRLIEGLPGLGLVGTVAATYLVQKLNMRCVGYVHSRNFPPLVSIHNYEPYYPMRLYHSKKYNLLVLLSEFIIPIEQVNELADEIIKFVKKHKIKEIISLGSISIKGEQDTVYVITSDKKLSKRFEDMKNVELIKEGATTGVTAMLLAEGKINNIPVTSLLAEAHAEYVDPRGASMVLKVLNQVLDLNIDTRELDREAEEIDRQMKEIISKGKLAHKKYMENMSMDNTMYK